MVQRRMNGLKIVWLETFLAVAEHQDFQVAAKVLGCDRSTVSRHIDELHSWLGANPISAHSPVRLSVAGAKFHPVAKQVVDLLNGSRTPDGVVRKVISIVQNPKN